MAKQFISNVFPSQSDNYKTNKGWAYFELKEQVFTQSCEVIEDVVWFDDEPDNENPCFSYQNIDPADNLLDAIKWLANEEMVAIVDESSGGIIGYVNTVHAGRINSILNGWKNI